MRQNRGVPRSWETILVVDDEDSVRTGVRQTLACQGYRVLDASDDAAAEQIVKLYVGPIHLLLAQVDPPKVSGRALADRLRSLHPELGVLFLSYQTSRELIRQDLLESGTPFLRKPFSDVQLTAKVSALLGHSK